MLCKLWIMLGKTYIISYITPTVMLTCEDTDICGAIFLAAQQMVYIVDKEDIGTYCLFEFGLPTQFVYTPAYTQKILERSRIHDEHSKVGQTDASEDHWHWKTKLFETVSGLAHRRNQCCLGYARGPMRAEMSSSQLANDKRHFIYYINHFGLISLF